MDERIGGVVAAGEFAFVAGGGEQFERAGFDVHHRVQFEEGFVDAAEFFAAEVAVVDRAEDAVLFDIGQFADGLQEVVVGEEGVVSREIASRVLLVAVMAISHIPTRYLATRYWLTTRAEQVGGAVRAPKE